MAQRGDGWYWHFGLASLLAMGGAIASLEDGALAQVTPDGTLGAESSVVTPVNIDGLPTEQIDGGARGGANLFHSFEQFSVPTGGAAYFNNASAIQNIISRVTGKSISNIDGLIAAKGTANLFLLNPNGIIFGPNASLNIGGSFVGSTASAVNFADGNQFSATAPQSTPLLTVSVPLGLQFGGTAGSILNQSQATNSSGEVVGLQVQPGKTLALVGGDVSLDGGNLQAPDGQVELGGVSGAGTVGLNVDGNNLSLSFPDTVTRADVSLTNRAEVDVNAGGAGSITVNARKLNLLGRSGFSAGGRIEPGLGSVGTQAGDITLNATGAMTIANIGFIINTGSKPVGRSGDINIKAGSLSLTDDALLSTINFAEGSPGSISIQANDAVSIEGSRIYTDLYTKGNSGDISIQARSLSLSDNTIIFASTFGKGDAGSIAIQAQDAISIEGSRIETNVLDTAIGNGGNINITAGSFSLTNGAALQTSTSGRGDAGSVTINSRDTVSFDGAGSNGYSSGAFSTVESGAEGNGGDINITTGLLSVTNGALLSASSEGSGAAGNVEVAADSIRLDNEAFLSSDTTGGQGNIILNSQDLVLRRGSNITTNASGTATGGNINIDADFIVALENSDITANASEGPGGRVIINAQGIFGTQFRDQPTPESDITASSDLGPQFSGIVEINTPDVDPSQGLVTLPAELTDASVLIASSRCGAGGRQGKKNEFIVTGRGGFPFRPGDAHNSYYATGTVRSIPDSSPSSETPRNSDASTDPSTNPTSSEPAPLIEAQGWVINDKGEVVLTAQANTATPHNPWMNPATCHSSTSYQQPLALGAR